MEEWFFPFHSHWNILWCSSFQILVLLFISLFRFCCSVCFAAMLFKQTDRLVLSNFCEHTQLSICKFISEKKRPVNPFQSVMGLGFPRAEETCQMGLIWYGRDRPDLTSDPFGAFRIPPSRDECNEKLELFYGSSLGSAPPPPPPWKALMKLLCCSLDCQAIDVQFCNFGMAQDKLLCHKAAQR